MPISNRALRECTLYCVEPMAPALGSLAVMRALETCGSFDSVFRPADIKTYAEGDGYAFSLRILNDWVERCETPFVLQIMWDGWPIDASCWTDEFLDYDVIGAPWPWHQDGMQVGCGPGIISRKALDAIKSTGRVPPRGDPLDNWIGRTIRPRLEADYGIKYAPLELAARYGFERHTPHHRTFCFHGVFNLWRTCSDYELSKNIIPLVADYVFRKHEMYELLGSCILAMMWDSVEAIIARAESVMGGRDKLINHVYRISRPGGQMSQIVGEFIIKNLEGRK